MAGGLVTHEQGEACAAAALVLFGLLVIPVLHLVIPVLHLVSAGVLAGVEVVVLAV